jgi:hypothetical protein
VGTHDSRLGGLRPRPVHRVAVAASIALALGWDKLILALAVIGSMTYLAAVGKIDPTAPVAIFTAILGYAFGASAPGTTQAAHDVASGNGGSE